MKLSVKSFGFEGTKDELKYVLEKQKEIDIMMARFLGETPSHLGMFARLRQMK